MLSETIPTKNDRILSYYSSEYPLIKEKINDAILNGSKQISNKGNEYIVARYTGYSWPNQELIDYLTEEYAKAGWSIYFETPEGDEDSSAIHIEIFEA